MSLYVSRLNARIRTLAVADDRLQTGVATLANALFAHLMPEHPTGNVMNCVTSPRFGGGAWIVPKQSLGCQGGGVPLGVTRYEVSEWTYAKRRVIEQALG